MEVDGQTFMIHAGKGHAATVVGVGGPSGTDSTSNGEAPMTLMDIQKPIPKPSSVKSQKTSKKQASRNTSAAPSPATSANQQRSKANVDQIANAIAEARRRNPSLGLDK